MTLDENQLLRQTAPLLEQLGDRPLAAEAIAKGATTSVWRLQSETRKYALRVFDDDTRALDGTIDKHIRISVRERGGLVTVPFLNSETTGLALAGKRWSLEPYIEGTHPSRGKLSRETCRKLGGTLALLHDLPAKKFGRPAHVSGDAVIGQKENAFDGLAQRFENPVPETWPDDFVHPLLAAAPDLADKIDRHLQRVSRQVRLGGSVICHADLHERQLVCQNNELVALIDFGDAAILDPHWDLGSVLYFHGKDNFLEVLAAYRNNAPRNWDASETATSFSVAIAMHHASRSRLPGKSHRLERAIRFLRQAA